MRIDATILKNMLVSGANALDNDKEAINNMNVFPVPDGDTGINMTLTLSAVRKMSGEYDAVNTLSAEAASAILRSARGNSGAILSLFFRGLAKAWKHSNTVGAEELAKGFRRGCDEAYRAVLKPSEGTILTVMRRSAEEAEAALERGEYGDETLVEFLEFIISKAQESLDDTPKMLPILKEVGVVDAGGCGFVTVLRGMIASLNGNPVELIAKEDSAPAADFSEFDTADITFPYCTECVTEKFPEFDEKVLAVSEVEILVQVLGRPKARLMMPVDCDADTAKAIALADDAVKTAMNGKEPKKVIFVQGRLVNIVI